MIGLQLRRDHRISSLYERLGGPCQIVESLSSPTITVRKLLYGRKPNTYRLYFDIVDTTVRILHIRHGARREPRRGELLR